MVSSKLKNAIETNSIVDPFVYEGVSPSLQELASCKISQTILYNYVSKCKKRDCRGSALGSEKLSFSELTSTVLNDKYFSDAVDSLNMPKRIENLLKSKLKHMSNELQQCIEYFRNRIYPGNTLSVLHRIHFFNRNWCVWYPNGDIDYKGTALNVLQSKVAALSHLEKFVILSDFCMETEIMKSVRLDMLPEELIQKAKSRGQREQDFNGNEDHLMYYWLTHLSLEVAESRRGLDDIETLEAVNHPSTIHHAAVLKYFWRQLTSDKQLSTACSLLHARHNVAHFKERFFSLLPLPQQWAVLMSSQPLEVEDSEWLFKIASYSPEIAFWAWTQIKHLIRKERFAEMVEYTLKHLTDEGTVLFMLRIWDTAYDHHTGYIDYVMTEEEIFDKFRCNFYDSLMLPDDLPPESESDADILPCAFELLGKYLSLKNPEIRKKLFLQYASVVGLRLDHNLVATLNSLIYLCVPNIEDTLNFKSLVTNSQDFEVVCVFLLWYRNYDLLDFKLEYYFPNEDTMREFKKKLLLEYYNESIISCEEYWEEYCEYVERSFCQDQSLFMEIKKHFISSAISSFPCGYGDLLKSLTRVTEMFSIIRTKSDNSWLDFLKKEFLQKFPTNFGKFLALYWLRDDMSCADVMRMAVNINRLLQWSIGDDSNSIYNYKIGTLVPNTFDRALSVMNQQYMHAESQWFSVFEHIDMFLTHLIGEEGKRQYKIDRLKSPSDFDLFSSIHQKRDELSLEIVLKWFCNYDNAAVRKFRLESLDYSMSHL